MSLVQNSQTPAPFVEAGPTFSKFSRVPGFRHRRIRVWALAVFAIVVLLGLQAALPELRLLRSFGGSVAGGAALLVFLAAMICEYVDARLGMGYGTPLTPLLLAGFEPLQIVPAVLLRESLTASAPGYSTTATGTWISFVTAGRSARRCSCLR